MKINFQADGVILTSKQKALMEKKIQKLKKYFNNKPVTIDIVLQDATSAEKGGVDQIVHLSVLLDKEKIFIEEIDDRLMRAFALALGRFERQLSRHHKKEIEREQGKGVNRFDKLLGIIRRNK